MKEHLVPRQVYFSVFAALMVLTALTVWVAFFDLGPLNTVVAMGIAVIKATLVVLYFMHLRWSSKLSQVVLVAGLFWFLILIALTFSDYLTR